MENKPEVLDAILALGIKNFSLDSSKSIVSESDFNNAFKKEISNVNGNTVYSKNQNDFGVNWSQVKSKLAELQADYDAKKYQRDRAESYPSWKTQMDLLYHGGVDALKVELKKTKDKFPKP